ncbi:WD repeat-containing protein 89-like isoform X2 [Stegodyphus dumicola]|nr:WD repeat-containing protein 89-like isoform X2 [Stegodyphus dumicola]
MLLDSVSNAAPTCLKGHQKTITDIKFSHEDPHMLFSSSLDGRIFIWDTRSKNDPVQTFYDDTDTILKPLSCFDFNLNENYVCAGTELVREDAFLIFWDRRTSKNLGGYWNCHFDDITQVQFHPTHNTGMASSSVDGLINVFDLMGCSEEDALLSTLNIGSSVIRFSWCKENLCCTTGNEEFQLWSVNEPSPYLSATRDELSQLSQYKADYLIDSFMVENSLYVASGSNQGVVYLYSAETKKLQLSCELQNGHSDVVRSIFYSEKGKFIATGGEDGVVSLWSHF